MIMPEYIPDKAVFLGTGKPELPLLHGITVNFTGFAPGETIEVRASSHRDAAYRYGKAVRDITQEALSEELGDPSDKPQLMEQVSAHLRHFSDLSDKGVFTVDGTDYGKRYLEQLEGFARGSGITLEEAAFLQMELDTGCQSIFVQDKKTGEIFVIHTEENVDDSELIKLNRKSDWKQPPQINPHKYNYRGVKATEKGKQLSFFGYPGLSGGGPAMGVNHETGTFVAVDSLFTKADETGGTNGVWVNAIASMMLDIGDIDKARRLVKSMNDYGVSFEGGYGIHMAQIGADPQLTSFEFGGGHAVEVKPKELPDRRTIGQPNYARSTELYAIDELNPDTGVIQNDPLMRQWAVEMKRRKRRLELMGALAGRAETASGRSFSPKEKIAFLKKLAANPYGDVDTTDGQARIKRDMTGLPSVWVAGYGVGIIGRDGLTVEIGKLQPPPIPGKEYGLREHTTNPRFVRADLEKLAG